MDKRGDQDNLTYGSNHVYSVPTFKRMGGGSVIGLPPFKRIDGSQSKSGQVTLLDKSDSKVKQYIATIETDAYKSLKKIHIKPNLDLPDPFASNRHTIEFDDVRIKPDKDSLWDSSDVDYRSIEGNKVKHIEEKEEVEEEGESFDDQMRRRTIEYNRALDQNPKNVSLWLEFIQFQDEAARGLDPTASTSQKNRTSLNEVKLSIFEKALDHNPTSEELIHAYLACGAEVWETIRLLRKWDTVLKDHPDSIRLWSDYINLRQTNFASFSFTQCVHVFEDALAVLGKYAQQAHGERKEDIESIMVYILLRACLFVKQSGYQEKAFAILQAAVEFNLFQPRIFEMTGLEQKKRWFTEFWESEVLRFGEKGALGWAEYYRKTNNGEDVPEVTVEKKNDEEEDEILTLTDWLHAEQAQENTHRLPLRMSQAEDEDTDPFRIPLIEDVKPFLFNITTFDARYSLIYSIFVFLGLPYTPPEIGTNTHFFTDTFTHNDLALHDFWPQDKGNARHLLWYVAGVPMNPEHTTAAAHPYSIPNSYPVGISELFAKSGSWFKASGKEFIHCNVDEQFTRNAFEQILAIEKNEHLMICYLAFESSCGQKLGRRLAKSLLKDNRASLKLWNAYAQMEKSHDRISEVKRRIIHMVMTNMLVTPYLHHSLDENTPSPTTTSILRAREYFSQRIAQLSTLSESEEERQAAFYTIVCCGLFEYLSSGISSAQVVYEHALEYIRERHAERGYAAEMLWTEYATLLYHHALSQTHKASAIRTAMERALALFPNNTMFLSFYVWNESKTKIYNRVQHLLNDKLKNANVILWLCTIYSELHRHKPYQVNSVRNHFEKAVQHTRSSILLWKYYIEFEMKQNDIQRAKTLFYRSIRECPWSKELYLLGIQMFEKTMTEKEKNELISLMMEKEIRIRIEIEEDLL
ncbi:NRDE-2, necessary for RNA interference-domain-containing protein [Gilbertella persicaria]|uniref:NRDE-2, necessary for RNA interference-domain-containing protein n=1 Tax=Gilbertella persicaria TaxID=101096 RepID=UPI00221F0529|nr:NRDE-2, necessary for RNA interference-domain-containing protein [Gilbertella persicaria]KAI8051900.1 NRDE-2, necessary for RNA interference-domain-containing protein [Gilbertella persicaria]